MGIERDHRLRLDSPPSLIDELICDTAERMLGETLLGPARAERCEQAGAVTEPEKMRDPSIRAGDGVVGWGAAFGNRLPVELIPRARRYVEGNP